MLDKTGSVNGALAVTKVGGGILHNIEKKTDQKIQDNLGFDVA